MPIPLTEREHTQAPSKGMHTRPISRLRAPTLESHFSKPQPVGYIHVPPTCSFPYMTTENVPLT